MPDLNNLFQGLEDFESNIIYYLELFNSFIPPNNDGFFEDGDESAKDPIPQNPTPPIHR